MPELYKATEIIEDKFIFASYSHDFKRESVIEYVKSLIADGVRIWIDPTFKVGDNWEETVKSLISHENCCGVVFFFSPNAVRSPNVGIERRAALEEYRRRGKKDYQLFYVNMNVDGRPANYMNIIKRAFEEISDNEVCRDMSFESLRVIMELIDEKAIYVNNLDKNALLDSINEKIHEVIDKSAVILENIEKQYSKKAFMELKLGSYEYDGERKAMRWIFLKYSDDTALLLLKEPLEPMPAYSIGDWLNGEFTAKAFSDEEKAYIQAPIRLLTYAESQEKTDILETGKQWWLSDTKGSMQMVVRDDGTVYTRGNNNRSFKNSVRPVISINLTDVEKLINN